MTGTFASRAFFTSVAIFGTDATHVGRGGQMTEVMSRTNRAAPLTGISTATGSGIFGIGEVGVGGAREMLGVATCGVGDVGPRLVGAALLGDAKLMLPIVVVGAVVVHDREHRQPKIRRGPKRAGIEQQVAVGLDVHDELPVAAMCERDTERDPDLRRRA